MRKHVHVHILILFVLTNLPSSMFGQGQVHAIDRSYERHLLSRCDSMIMDADSLTYIEKQIAWKDAQRQVSVYADLHEDGTSEISFDYYTQLLRMLVYMDPFKSMDVHRPYIVQLDSLTHQLPAKHIYLRWYAFRKLSQLYALDERQKRAYELLEEIIQGVSNKPIRDSRDTLYLTKAMVGQLYCYQSLPPVQGSRNITFLSHHASDNRTPLGIALYRKNHQRVISICDSLLSCHDLRLVETFSILHYLSDALAHSPKTVRNAQHMMHLLDKQTALYAEVRDAIDFDYSKYQKYQEKRRLESEMIKARRQDEVYHMRVGSVIGLVVLLLIFIVWVIYHYESIFEESILQQVRAERDRRKANLLDSKKAYQAQLDLVRNLNHDIRIPLNALLGYSYLLSSSDEISASDQVEARQIIRKSSDMLLDMINNLLSIARVETGKMSIHKHPTPACELLNVHDWDDYIARVSPDHLVYIQPHRSSRTVHTDYGHVRRILGLIVKDIVRQTESSSIFISSHITTTSDVCTLYVDTPISTLSLVDMYDALDSQKKMSDYEDAGSYYLVLARMITAFIGGRLILLEDNDNVHFELSLPIR